MSTTKYLLADARASLERQLGILPQPGVTLTFAAWLGQLQTTDPQIKNTVSAAVLRSGAQQDFQTVATLGFALGLGILDGNVQAALIQGVERLVGRQPFVDDIPMPFCSDAIGLLGVVVGSSLLAEETLLKRVSAWLGTFIRKIWEIEGTEDWQRAICGAIDYILGNALLLPSDVSPASADVRVALRAKAVLPSTSGDVEDREAASALALIGGASSTPTSYERAALRLCALDWIIRANPVVVPGRIVAKDLIKLLERVPAGLRKWSWEKKPRTAGATPVQWPLNNEYHVQNLLWAQLAPLLPDLDDEQYLEKIGHKTPRSDLYVPSLKLIIEIKFLRPGDKFQKIIEEIAADTALYRPMGSDLKDIVAFVWDDSARSHEHDYLKNGLKKLPGMTDVVVASRPGNWT